MLASNTVHLPLFSTAMKKKRLSPSEVKKEHVWSWFTELSLDERVCVLSIEDKEGVRLLQRMYKRKMTEGDGLFFDAEGEASSSLTGLNGLFHESGNGSLGRKLNYTSNRLKNKLKSIVGKRDFCFKRMAFVDRVCNYPESLLAADAKLEEAVRLCDMCEYLDSMTVAASVLAKPNYFLYLMEVASRGGFLTVPCQVDYDENARRWVWEDPKWFVGMGYYTLGTFICQLLEKAIWMRYFEQNAIDPRRTGKAVRHGSKYPIYPDGKNSRALLSKAHLTQFWTNLSLQTRRRIVGNLAGIVVGVMKENYETASKGSQPSVTGISNKNRSTRNNREKVKKALKIPDYPRLSRLLSVLVDISMEERLMNLLFKEEDAQLEKDFIQNLYFSPLRAAGTPLHIILRKIGIVIQAKYTEHHAMDLIMTEEGSKRRRRKKSKKGISLSARLSRKKTSRQSRSNSKASGVHPPKIPRKKGGKRSSRNKPKPCESDGERANGHTSSDLYAPTFQPPSSADKAELDSSPDDGEANAWQRITKKRKKRNSLSLPPLEKSRTRRDPSTKENRRRSQSCSPVPRDPTGPKRRAHSTIIRKTHDSRPRHSPTSNQCFSHGQSVKGRSKTKSVPDMRCNDYICPHESKRSPTKNALNRARSADQLAWKSIQSTATSCPSSTPTSPTSSRKHRTYAASVLATMKQTKLTHSNTALTCKNHNKMKSQSCSTSHHTSAQERYSAQHKKSTEAGTTQPSLLRARSISYSSLPPMEEVEGKEDSSDDEDDIILKDTRRKLHREVVACVKFLRAQTRTKHGRHAASLIEKITTAVNSVYPQAFVQVYGSFASELHIPSSDLDLVIGGVDSPRIPSMRKLASELQKLDWIQHCQPILTARVPVIKLFGKEEQIPADITFDCPSGGALHSGVMATRVVRYLVRTLPALEYLVLVLKQFLYERGLSNAYTGGLSSYCLVLMVASYLQLYAKHKGSYVKRLDPEDEEIARLLNDITPPLLYPASSRRIDMSRYGTLLLGFLHFYGRCFNFHTTGICIRNGGSHFPLQNHVGVGFSEYPLVIVDPLNVNYNLGANAFGMYRVKAAFESAYAALVNSFASCYSPTLLGRILVSLRIQE